MAKEISTVTLVTGFQRWWRVTHTDGSEDVVWGSDTLEAYQTALKPENERPHRNSHAHNVAKRFVEKGKILK